MDPLEWIARAPLPFLARCRVAADLDSVTRIGHEDPLDGAGVAASEIDEIWRAAQALYRTGATPALQLCIRRR